MSRKPFDVDSIMADLQRDVSEDLAKIATRAVSAVVYATPVGNPSLWKSPAPPGYRPGHARRNWHCTIGRTSSSELPGLDPSGQTVILETGAVIREWSKPTFKRQPLHIQNAVPYIERLNDGWSSQAPAGFVEKSVLAANGVNSHDKRELE